MIDYSDDNEANGSVHTLSRKRCSDNWKKVKMVENGALYISPKSGVLAAKKILGPLAVVIIYVPPCSCNNLCLNTAGDDNIKLLFDAYWAPPEP